jgi:hypothetical protein
MNIQNHSPVFRVAKLIRRYLRDKGTRTPNMKLLTRLLETVYFASMKSEEGRPTLCTLTFVDARNPAGKDPPKIRPHRRSFVPLDDELPFTVRNLVKLAPAIPPWAACVAICGRKGAPVVCGLFDQEIHYRNNLNREAERGRFLRPGYFQVEIIGTAGFAVYDNRNLIAVLNQNVLVDRFHDVFAKGPISQLLTRYWKHSVEETQTQLGEKQVSPGSKMIRDATQKLWLRSLSRILLTIKRTAHGGTILLIPDYSTDDLAVKYAMNYSKLETVISKHVSNELREDDAWNKINDRYVERGKDQVPTLLHLVETVAANEKEEAIKAELGCVNFIASLASIDGLVLLAGGLVVRGFGVEITRRLEPKVVYLASDEDASPDKLRKIDYTHFGTRHRSMMRYCNHHPDSIGFVISQDGDIRTMTKIGSHVVMWENIRLQEIDAVTKNTNRDS